MSSLKTPLLRNGWEAWVLSSQMSRV